MGAETYGIAVHVQKEVEQAARHNETDACLAHKETSFRQTRLDRRGDRVMQDIRHSGSDANLRK